MQSHEIANLMSTTVQVLENASGTRSGTESLPKVFFHDNCEQISYNFFRLSQKGRNEKQDSFYTAKRVSSVDSCRDKTRLSVFSVPFFQNKFQTCFFHHLPSTCHCHHLLWWIATSPHMVFTRLALPKHPQSQWVELAPLPLGREAGWEIGVSTMAGFFWTDCFGLIL